MPRHHRCNICGRDFEDDGDALREHVERRHPDADVRWWVVVEEAGVLPFERSEP